MITDPNPRQGTGSVVTMGESLALLTTPSSGRVSTGPSLHLGFGGAESNVAIALARLGVRSTWISRLGDDALGTLINREIRAEGVDVVALRDPAAPTGMMLKEYRKGRPWRVRYYRSGSAAARLSPADIDEAAIARADVLHLTGITAALGEQPLGALEYAIEVARRAGTLVSFDVNHRQTLWSAERAAPVLSRLVAAADLVFAGPEEAALVLGESQNIQPATTFESGAELARRLAKLGPPQVVIKLGALGSLAFADGEMHEAPTRPVEVLDAVGAGDAFVGGYLSELVAAGSVPDCLRMGNQLGGAVCQVPGDWEGLPTRDELHELDDTVEIVR